MRIRQKTTEPLLKYRNDQKKESHGHKSEKIHATRACMNLMFLSDMIQVVPYPLPVGNCKPPSFTEFSNRLSVHMLLN